MRSASKRRRKRNKKGQGRSTQDLRGSRKEKEEAITPRNLHDVLNGVDSTQTEMRAVDNDKEEHSPLKKQSGSSKFSTKRTCAHQVTPSEATNVDHPASSSTKSTTFLDSFIYPFPCMVIELAMALKGGKPFDEFTQALMAFIFNVQMVDLKFVINSLNPDSKEKNISSKKEISPNMTKMGTHIKISGNGNVFNKKKVWENQGNDHKCRKNLKDEFCNPVVWFSMVVSSKVQPQEIIDQMTHEWACLNSTQLQIKDLQSTESETVVTFFKVSTLTPKEVILAEFTKVLLEAQRRVLDDLLDTSIYDFFMDNGI
jgi:hypothetical protein